MNSPCMICKSLSIITFLSPKWKKNKFKHLLWLDFNEASKRYHLKGSIHIIVLSENIVTTLHTIPNNQHFSLTLIIIVYEWQVLEYCFPSWCPPNVCYKLHIPTRKHRLRIATQPCHIFKHEKFYNKEWSVPSSNINRPQQRWNHITPLLPFEVPRQSMLKCSHDALL